MEDHTPSSCHQVRTWLMDQGPDAPEAAILAHVASCRTCQGALVLLLLPNGAGRTLPTCPACQQDLAASIDDVRERGRTAARQAYPHVWLHLLRCSACAETYRMTTLMLDIAAELSTEEV